VKKLLLSTVLALGWFATPVAPAHAQTAANCGVNFNPTIGVNCANIRQATYVGQIIGLVPQAAASDIFCIDGSATKAIHVRRVELSGTATAAGSAPITFIKRNTLDTGTAGTPNITKLSVNNPAATATLVSYTANPTITDTTSHQTARASVLILSNVTTPAVSQPVVWAFGTPVDAYEQGFDIAKGATTVQICINYGLATTAGNLLYGMVEWTED
jgi:hypothetical protein